jgi:phosphosulfolactate synthase (CoM biosynthesis protein A)
MIKKAFDFVKIDDLPPKPRKYGLIEIRGPYYTSVSYGYLKDLLDDWGEYVDGYKFAGGSMRLLSKEKVKKIIKICHDYNVYVSTGGFIERVILQGDKAVDNYIEECKELDFDVIEISSGFISIPLDYKLDMVKRVMNRGLKAKPEVSLIIGAGGGTHIIGYEEEIKLRSVEDFIQECRIFINGGVNMIMIESEGITEDLPPEKWRTDVVKKLIDNFGFEKLMFEASDPPVFKWYLKNISKNVNLFIDHTQIVEFTAWKLGLWGDKDIWKDFNLNR